MAIIPDQTGKNISIDTPQKKKTRKLTAILTGVVIFTAGVVYFGFFSGQSTPPVDSTLPAAGTMPGSINGAVNPLTSKEAQSNAALESLGKTTLDSPLFSGKQLDSLNISDKLPVVVGPKGRDNPFAPF